MNLTIREAEVFVRSRIDELPHSESEMLSEEIDDRNLGETVKALLHETVKDVLLMAPAPLLEGSKLVQTDNKITYYVTEDGVLDLNFDIAGTPVDMLRMLSFQCGDGKHDVASALDDDSPAAKIQENKYIRATKEYPVLVRMSDSKTYRPHYKYYTTDLNTANVFFTVLYIPVPTLLGSTDAAYYVIPETIRENILNQLTARVLITYKDAANAETFLKLAQF